MPLAEALADPLIGAYAEVWDDLVGELGTLTDPAQWRRRERIRELLVTIDAQFRSLEAPVRQFTERDLREVYGLGHAWTANTVGVQGAFAIQYTEALTSLESGLRDRLLAETRSASTLMQRQVRDAARLATRSSIAGGTPAQAAAQRMTEILRGSGLHSVTYNNGARHSIKTYSEMAVRTTTAQAYNEGSFALGSQIGVLFYEVFDGPTCGWTFHEDPNLADGMIVTDDEARAWPISHPNCRRTFGARPDLQEKPDGRVEHRVSPPTSAAEARERARLEQGLVERRRPGRRSNPGVPRAEAPPPPVPRDIFRNVDADRAFAQGVRDHEFEIADTILERQMLSSVELTEGAVAETVEMIRFEGGDRLVYKSARTADNLSTEVLASRVSRAVGFDRRVDVFDDQDGGMLMRFVDGKPAADLHTGAVNPNIAEADRVRTALLDFLTGNADRHGLNGIVDSRNRLVPIDNGEAKFRGLVAPQKPTPDVGTFKLFDIFQFGEEVDGLLGVDRVRGTFTDKRFVANRLEPNELDIIAGRLEGFRPEFEKYGRGGDLDNVLDRLAMLRQNAQGGQSILGG